MGSETPSAPADTRDDAVPDGAAGEHAGSPRLARQPTDGVAGTLSEGMPASGTVPSFAEIADALWICGALAAANRLGVCHRLDQGPASVADLVADNVLAERGAGPLLDALVQLGLVSRDEAGRYRTTVPNLAELSGRLIRESESLTDVLRTGRPTGSAVDRRDGSQRYYPAVLTRTDAAKAEPAARAAAELAVRAPHEVLDVGAGTAPWSLAVARLVPACRVTALDLPGVLPMTRAAVAAAGCSSQYTFIGADVHTDLLPDSAYDLILVANVCQLFDADTARRLLANVARWLRPNGTLALIHVVSGGAGERSLSASLYNLGLLTRTATGRAHSFADYKEWLVAAGLTQPRGTDLGGFLPFMLISATKPPGTTAHARTEK